ncbi:unnamed protein product [Vitrella brassicaformis CCMP3155]|uniref:Uncharacterized protein n=1 Tax=Vitrella brassicaformis (strain CCMP3155) TaxID=1169540 RepID=A0A0G4EMX2_VITBC|nr:unnamed protein product [Vitrella brassicaformis CCMP3155]|eukprot:CEL98164.1 unnamed protein product [Vitrella brassicaformis CCMP3155]
MGGHQLEPKEVLAEQLPVVSLDALLHLRGERPHPEWSRLWGLDLSLIDKSVFTDVNCIGFIPPAVFSPALVWGETDTLFQAYRAFGHLKPLACRGVLKVVKSGYGMTVTAGLYDKHRLELACEIAQEVTDIEESDRDRDVNDYERPASMRWDVMVMGASEWTLRGSGMYSHKVFTCMIPSDCMKAEVALRWPHPVPFERENRVISDWVEVDMPNADESNDETKGDPDRVEAVVAAWSGTSSKTTAKVTASTNQQASASAAQASTKTSDKSKHPYPYSMSVVNGPVGKLEPQVASIRQGVYRGLDARVAGGDQSSIALSVTFPSLAKAMDRIMGKLEDDADGNVVRVLVTNMTDTTIPACKPIELEDGSTIRPVYLLEILADLSFGLFPRLAHDPPIKWERLTLEKFGWACVASLLTANRNNDQSWDALFALGKEVSSRQEAYA